MNIINHKLNDRVALIDVLRLLAVVLVLLDHVKLSGMHNGWVGVDIFFVISGYVILASLHNRTSVPVSSFYTRLNISIKFAVDRLVRLVPSLIAIVVLGLILVALFDVPLEFSSHFLTGVASVTSQANITIYNSSLDYFGAAAQRNIFMHLWSLGVEFQFYLSVAVFCIFLNANLIMYDHNHITNFQSLG